MPSLILNFLKTKLIINFCKSSAVPKPLYINGDCVERVPVFKFLGTHISSDLSWTTNTTTVVKKAQQRLHFLRILKQNHLQKKLLVSFYHYSIESVLTYCISVWYASCSTVDRRALQRIISTAQKIIGCPLPSLEVLAPAASVEQPTYLKTHPTLDISCLTGCPLVDVSGLSHHGQTDLKTASTPEPFVNWTLPNNLHRLSVFLRPQYHWTLHRCK